MWLERQGCHDTVKRVWRAVYSDPPMSRVIQNVHTGKTQLQVWSKKEFCNVVNTLSKKKKILRKAEKAAVKGGSVEVFLQLKGDVAELLRVEEKCGNSEATCIGWYQVTKILVISIIRCHSVSGETTSRNLEIHRID